MQSIANVCVQFVFGVYGAMVHWIFSLIYDRKSNDGPAATAPTTIPAIRDEILYESVTSLARKIRQKKIKCIDVVNTFIKRIEEINPIVNCMVDERFAAAIRTAEQYDNELATNRYSEEELHLRKPLYGVPFTTKDSIAIQGLKLTAGLYYRKGLVANENAECIQAMVDAGGIPLALTNVSELCMWWESANVVYGRTKNPYNTTRIVGGSSGGEACLLTSCGSACGLGSDIGGSIRMPALFNGIFGHKPSAFVVSNKGVWPPQTETKNEFLAVGPMCKYADDLTLILKVIAKPEKISQLQLDKPVDLTKLRIFYQDNNAGGLMVSKLDSDMNDAFKKVIGHFKSKQLQIEKVQFEKFKYSTKIWFACMKSENPKKFSRLLANGNLTGTRTVNLVWELIKWPLGQSNYTFINLLAIFMEIFGYEYGSTKHQQVLDLKNEFKKELEDLLGADGVLLYPTHPTPALYHNEPIFKAFNYTYTAIVNCFGFPTTHCPLGLSVRARLPVGLQVIANRDQDRLCLAIARELEQVFGGWIPPKK